MRPPSVRLVDALPLRTSRLTLRPLGRRDADVLAAMLADPAVMRHFPHPMSRAESDGWLRRNLTRYDDDGTGLFAVCRGDEWIGDCGLLLRRLDRVPVLELGYHLRRDTWGHGYATEAARACLDLAFSMTDVASVVALIRPGNRPSRRVAARLGAALHGAVLHAGLPHDLWHVTRSAATGALQ